MQFSDRVRIESRLFHLYELYGSTTLETHFTPNEMQFSDRLRIKLHIPDRIGLARSDEQYSGSGEF